MRPRLGFTLFEVIVVVAVLSVGLLVVVQIFPLGLRVKEKAEISSIATLLGQQIMEEIKRRGYDDLNATYPSEIDGYGAGEGEFKEHKGYRYQVEWWDTDNPYLRKVKVRIFYERQKINEGEGKYEENSKEDENPGCCLELVTYLARRK